MSRDPEDRRTDARRYELLSLLGSGGFGTVYRARFQGEGGFTKEVALKMLHPSAEASAEVLGRLRDEARLLGLLRHRAIVQVDRLTLLDDRWTVVMEYVDGVDLATLVRAGRVPLGPALEIVAEIAGALHAAWTWPIEQAPLQAIHRDIKPSNLRLTRFGELKILDFGIARAEFAAREAHTRSVHFGSPDYMAPERLAFEGDGPAGDVYAVGAVLYEMLAAEALGRSSPLLDRHATRLIAARARLEAMHDLPEEAVALVMDALAGDPEARPTAEQLERRAMALRAAVGGEALRFWAGRVVPGLGGSQPLDPKASGTILVEGEAGGSSDTWAGKDSEALARPTLAPVPGETIATQVGATLEVPEDDVLDEGPGHAGAFRHLALRIAAVLGALAVVFLAVRGATTPAVEPAPEPVLPVSVAPPAPAPAPPAPVAPSPPESAPPTPVVTPTVSARVAKPPVSGAAPAPAAAPSPAPASVHLSGDAVAVSLVNGAGTFPLPGEVPAGTYTIRARFGDQPEAGAGQVSLSAGESVTLNCKSGFERCSR